MMYSGIDLHSNNSVIAVIDDGDRVVAQKRLPNDIAKIVGFLAQWQEQLTGVVVESTYNWYWLVDGLQDASFHVHLANTAFSSRAPVDLTLLSTDAEATIRRLFDDPGYPWWAQSQFAVLSQSGASSPEFDKIEFDPAALFNREWPERFGDLRSLGVQAILRPGVDGDVAGLLCLSSEVRDRFESILSHSAEELHMSLNHVSAGGFARALASLPS
jgi:hypothetical protein